MNAPSRYAWVKPVLLTVALTALSGGVAWGLNQNLSNEHRLTNLEAKAGAQVQRDDSQDDRNKERYEQLREDIKSIGAKLDKLLERQVRR